MAKNLAVTVVIGGTLSSTFSAAFANAGATVRTLGATAKALGDKQKALGASIEKYAGTLAPKTLAGLHRNYQRLGQLIDEAKRKQEALTASMKRGAALSAQRADLRSQAMGTIGAGLAIGAPIALAVREAGAFQDQMRDIAITGQLSTKEEAAVAATVRENAKRWGLAHSQIGEGIQALVAGGIQSAEELKAYTPSVAKSAVATRATVGDVAASFIAMGQNLQITAKDAESAFAMLALTGKRGQFEVRDAAKWLPTLAPQFAALGVTGKDAVAQIGAALQVARTGAGTADQAANNLSNFLAKITQDKTKKDFSGAGIDIGAAMRSDAAKGVSPVESMIGAIERYVSAKGPEASRKFQDAMKIEDAAKRDAAMQALQSAYKLSELFVDRQVLDFIRPMLAQKDMYQQIKAEALAEGAKAPGQTQMDKDAAARMDTFFGRMGKFKSGVFDLGITIGNALLPAFNGVVDSVTPAIDAIGRFAEAHPGVIKNAVGLAAALIGGKLAFIGLRYGFNIVASAANIVGTAFHLLSGKWTLLRIALQAGNLARIGSLFATLGASVGRFAGLIGGALMTGLRAAGTAFMMLGRAMLALVANPIGGTITVLALGALLIYKNWDKIGPLFARVGQAIVQAFEKGKAALEILKSAFNAGLAYLRGLVGQFFSVGANCIGGLVDGIKSKLAAAKAAIVGLGQTIKSTITGALGIKSPSTVFAGFGHMLVAGLAQGLGRASPSLAGAMRGVYEHLTRTMPPTLPLLGVTPMLPTANRPLTTLGVTPMLPGGNVVPFQRPAGAATEQLRRMLADYNRHAQTPVPGLPTPTGSGQSGKSVPALRAPARGGTVIHFNPTITIQGGKDPEKTKKAVTDALKLSMREFDRVAGQVRHAEARTTYR